MRKQLRLLALVLAVSVALSGCGGSKKDCAHDYYASDYSAPTANENGYNEYTCKKCGDSYKEVIPMLSAEVTSTDDTDNGYKKDDRTVRLFDLPVYSSNREPSYLSDYTDDAGYRHENCYEMMRGWVRYDLDGKYSKLNCKLYADVNDMISGVIYVEFYDGDEFLGSTAKMTYENFSTEYELDISNVKYLTIHVQPDTYNGDSVIFDPITISK